MERSALPEPVQHIALGHFAEVQEDIFPHLDMLRENQIGDKQPRHGAATFHGIALGDGMLMQAFRSLYQTGQLEPGFQGREILFRIDIDQMVGIFKPINIHITPQRFFLASSES